MSLESTIQAQIRLRLSALQNNLVLRYQVGTFLTMDGRPVKVGQTGVSDLIGLVSHTIRPEDIGRTVGIFVALETKQVKDSTHKDRKISQGNFIDRVRALGGIAGIVRSVGDAEKLIDWTEL